jgi:hypothetical protein
MKLRQVIKEAEASSTYPGGGATYSTPAPFSYTNNYIPNSNDQYGSRSKLDKDVEDQLIDRGIDILINEFPFLIEKKKIRLHFINMLVGKITSGEVADLIDVKHFIKKLKKRTGISVA